MIDSHNKEGWFQAIMGKNVSLRAISYVFDTDI